MEGKRFGRLVVESFHSRDGNYNRRFLCICDCGNQHVVLKHKLTDGGVKSCGCLGDELRREAKEKAARERRKYTRKSYDAMVGRCTDPRRPAYPKYGAVGITVCDRWLHGEGGKSGWDCFYEDMGPRPEWYSIDRVDNYKGYCKENCRWATRKQQAANKRPK